MGGKKKILGQIWLQVKVKGGKEGMKSLADSIFCSWKIGSVINIRIPHGNVSQKTSPAGGESGRIWFGGGFSSKENVLLRVTEKVNIGTKTFHMTYTSQGCHNIWCPSWTVSYGSCKKKTTTKKKTGLDSVIESFLWANSHKSNIWTPSCIKPTIPSLNCCCEQSTFLLCSWESRIEVTPTLSLP